MTDKDPRDLGPSSMPQTAVQTLLQAAAADLEAKLADLGYRRGRLHLMFVQPVEDNKSLADEHVSFVGETVDFSEGQVRVLNDRFGFAQRAASYFDDTEVVLLIGGERMA